MDNGLAALVTGASSGIGRATALSLAAAGYTTYGTSRRPGGPVELESEGVRPLTLDVTDEASRARAVAVIEAVHGAVDVLVNNAGYSEVGAVEEVSLGRVRRQFETNVFGAIRLAQLVLPGMRRKGRGRIVNVSSMGGELTVPFAGIYHASKYALEALSDALRFEVEPFGVRVVVVQPGVVATPLAQSTLEGLTPAQDSPYAERLRRFRRFLEANAAPADGDALTPDDVARVILRAVQAGDPEPRYPVGREAEELLALRRRLGDRGWDELYRRQF